MFNLDSQVWDFPNVNGLSCKRHLAFIVAFHNRGLGVARLGALKHSHSCGVQFDSRFGASSVYIKEVRLTSSRRLIFSFVVVVILTVSSAALARGAEQDQQTNIPSSDSSTSPSGRRSSGCLEEARHGTNGRKPRLAHGILMMTADAGFVATVATAPHGVHNHGLPTPTVDLTNRSLHRNVAIGSISVGTVGYLLMLLGKH
jgi:hypothetical protein